MRLARLVYSTLFTLLVPLILLRLLWRARRQRGYIRHIGERFGFYPPAPERPLNSFSYSPQPQAWPLFCSLSQAWSSSMARAS